MFKTKQSKGNPVLILLILLSFNLAKSQDMEGTMPYSVDLISNPAFTGSGEYGNLKLVYRDYFPGNGFNLNSLYVGYDTFSESIHGGAGMYISENNMGGIINDIKIGANYAYHLRASRDLYVNAGFNVSLLHRSLNGKGIVLPDQIDPYLGPVLPSGDLIDLRSRTIFDLGVGFLFSFRNFNAGIALSHLGKPDLIGQNKESGRLKRRMLLHFDASFFEGDSQLEVTPIAFLSLQDQFIYGAIGAELTYNIMSVNILGHLSSGAGIFSIQPGFSFETERLIISYNHLFSPGKGVYNIPVSQSNLISVQVRLNNVNKSEYHKAIKTPKL